MNSLHVYLIYLKRAALVALFLSTMISCKSVERSVDKSDSFKVESKDIEVRVGRSFYDSTVIYKQDDFKVTFSLDRSIPVTVIESQSPVDFNMLKALVERSKEVTISGSSVLNQATNISEVEDSVYLDNSATVIEEVVVRREVVRKQSFFSTIGVIVIVVLCISAIVWGYMKFIR